VHALGIAEALGIGRVVIPPAPGLFSSLALLFSEVEHHFVQTHFQRDGEDDGARLEKVLAQLEEQGRAALASEGYHGDRARLDRFADVRYAGQNSELTIPVAPGALTPAALAALREAFAAEHENTYGYRSDGETVHIVGLRLVARGLSSAARVPERLRLVADAEATAASREAYFGPHHGWRATPVLTRPMLAGGPGEGPLIIEEYDATTVVPPGWRATLDAGGNIMIGRLNLGGARRSPQSPLAAWPGEAEPLRDCHFPKGAD
jgi:N-methylhydantoinase A